MDNKEYKAYMLLSDAISSVYDAEKLLGEEHQEYDAMEKAYIAIITASCRFHKYFETDAGIEEQKESSLLLE